MKKFAAIKLHDLSNLLTARLSRHIVLWVFASLVVIEAIILIPSVQRREREILNQIRQVSSGKVFWIATTYPNISARAFLDRVQQLQKDPMLQILGGAVYTSDGQLIGTFGEKPALNHAGVMADNPMSFEASDRPMQNSDRYDASWLIPHTGGNHILVIRHNASSTRSEIFAFIFRATGMVLIISAVLTVTTLAALAITVITPILRLREDLIAAGEAISKDQPTPLFYSAIVKRHDELGDVIAAFNQMFKQIWQAMVKRKQAEQALAEANQEIT
ncbi:MAG: sensor with HAMP domain-containing protein, partial [Kovacikia sp.]